MSNTKISNSLKIQLKILTFCGFWMPENLSEIKKKLYKLYSISTMSFFMGIYTITYLVQVLTTDENLEKSVQLLLIILQFSMYAKAAPLSFCREKILEMVKCLDEKEFQPTTPNQAIIIQNKIALIKKIFISSLCVYLSVVLAWAIIPFFKTETTTIHNLSKLHLMSGKAIYFLLVYIYQILIYTYFTTVTCTLDFFIIGKLININAQLDILADKLENGEDAKDDAIQGNQKEQFLKDCIVHHNKIIW